MEKKAKWVLLGSGGLLVLVAIGFLLSGSGVPVETATIERGALQVTVAEEGRTRVRQRYVVAAPVAGRLARIPVDEGDAVADSTVVARIYPMPEGPRDAGIARAEVAAADARRREAAARVVAAEARAGQTAREAERSRALHEAGAQSEQARERAELVARSAREELEAARSALEAATAELAARRTALVGADASNPDTPAEPVYAPTSGRVLRVLEESERVVQAGTPLVEIGDAEGLEVVVDVLSADAVPIRPSDRVLFDEWGGDEALEGTVRLVEPAAFTEVSALGVEEQRVNVIVDLFDPPVALGAGYRLEARIVTWSGDDVLRVPTSALFQRNGQWTVFAVEDREAVSRTVRVGHRSTEAAEVLDGLEEGERVILYPSDEIDDGVSVEVRSD